MIGKSTEAKRWLARKIDESISEGVGLLCQVMPRPRIPVSHLGGAPELERKFRLMEVVRRTMRERRFSLRTQEAYAGWIRRYIQFYGRRHPADLDAADVAAFLSDLTVRLSDYCVSPTGSLSPFFTEAD